MAFLALAIALITLFLPPLALAWLRVRTILDPQRQKPTRASSNERTHLLIVLGSGGHSTEMLSMLERAVQNSDEKLRLRWSDYSYRTWVVSSGDSISALRAKGFEDMVTGLLKKRGEANERVENGPHEANRVVIVPRAREIHQSLLTTPVSCLKCLLACWSLLLPSEGVDFPDLILCNGPATATIVIFTSILLRFFDIGECNSRGKMRTIYIESWARVKRLSLSGKLLLHVVDRFLVQWPQLLGETRRKGEYLGVLV
jgi:beta-1,4-N-acetylglucosaminyltransferase